MAGTTATIAPEWAFLEDEMQILTQVGISPEDIVTAKVDMPKAGQDPLSTRRTDQNTLIGEIKGIMEAITEKYAGINREVEASAAIVAQIIGKISGYIALIVKLKNAINNAKTAATDAQQAALLDQDSKEKANTLKKLETSLFALQGKYNELLSGIKTSLESLRDQSLSVIDQTELDRLLQQLVDIDDSTSESNIKANQELAEELRRVAGRQGTQWIKAYEAPGSGVGPQPSGEIQEYKDAPPLDPGDVVIISHTAGEDLPFKLKIVGGKLVLTDIEYNKEYTKGLKNNQQITKIDGREIISPLEFQGKKTPGEILALLVAKARIALTVGAVLTSGGKRTKRKRSKRPKKSKKKRRHRYKFRKSIKKRRAKRTRSR